MCGTVGVVRVCGAVGEVRVCGTVGAERAGFLHQWLHTREINLLTQVKLTTQFQRF